MSHAIIRDTMGHRHAVDFGNEPVEISVYVTDDEVEIIVEATDHDRRQNGRQQDGRQQDGRRCSLLSLPRHQFAKAFREITYRRADSSRTKTLRSV